MPLETHSCLREGKNLVCPNCQRKYPILKHVALAPKGSGECKRYGKCPECGYECCADNDELAPELTPQPGK